MAQGFKATEIFSILEEALRNEGEELVKKIKGIFAFKVKGPQGNTVTWIVDVKNGSGKVELNGKGILIKLQHQSVDKHFLLPFQRSQM